MASSSADKGLPRWVVVAVLAASVVLLAWHALQYRFVTDDAYISFRYSWNLAHHGQLTFNLGERVEGYTNFLWTVLIGGMLRLGVRPELSSQVLGLLFGAAAIVLLYLLTRVYRGGRANPWDLLGSLWLALAAHMAVWCSSGLETQLFTALMLAGIVVYLAEQNGRLALRCRTGVLGGLLFALAALTRPEGMLVFGLTAVHRAGVALLVQRRWRPRVIEWAWVAGFLLPFAAHFAWRYSYYGYPLPNTYYVKAGGDGWRMLQQWGLPYLADFFRESKLYLVLPLVLFWRPRTTPAVVSGDSAVVSSGPAGARPWLVWSYLALIVLPYLAYIAWVGGDFMSMGRFVVPLLPLLAFFAQEVLREVVDRNRAVPQAWRAWRVALVVPMVLAATAYNSRVVYRASQKLAYHRWGLDTPAYLRKFADDRIRIGTWMREHFPADTTIAVGGAGAIVYASRFEAIDAFGLNDTWVAHHGRREGTRPGHSAFAPLSYVLGRHPDLMCHIGKHQDRPYRPPPSEQAYWRQHGYHWICLDPGGITPRYYCCLQRLDRALGPFPAEVGS